MENSEFQKVKQNLQCFDRPIFETLISTMLGMIESGELPPGMKFPPDKKLAHELGISHVTLARALNELRRRNVLLRRRASGTSVPSDPQAVPAVKARKRIAVVFDSATEKTFHEELFLQLHHALEELGCTMMFFSSDNNSQKQMNQLKEILEDFSVSGCIVWSILSHEQVEEVLRERPKYYPLIFLDKYYPGLDHDSVTYANYDSGVAIGKMILKKKINECFWIMNTGIARHSSVSDRKAGLLSVLPPEIEVKTIQLDENDNSMLPLAFGRSSAIVCADNFTACHLKRLSLERGLRLPRHLYDFESYSDDHSSITEFTALVFPCELGTEAVRVLASRLNGKEACIISHPGKWQITLGVHPVAATRKSSGKTPQA